MQFSVGVEYALHCLLYMVDMPSGKTVGIKDLSTYQGVSETYLSKIFTKLRKQGVVNSVPGMNGGYELAKAPEHISFRDVVEAIEGQADWFQCAEIRQNELLLDKEHLPDSYSKCPCLIKVVMSEAEEQMKSYLQTKTLGWLHAQVGEKIPAEHAEAIQNWFSSPTRRKK